MRHTLTLCYLLTTSYLTAQCPTAPELIQVIPQQRSAQVLLSAVGDDVDSVQIIIGDEFFRRPVAADADSVYTFTEFPYNLYGLEPSSAYNVYARTFCDGTPTAFSSREYFVTDAAGPPPGDKSTQFDFIASGLARCDYRPGTTRDATGPELAQDTCGGVGDDDVFYRFTASHSDYRFTFRTVGGTDPNVYVQMITRRTGSSSCMLYLTEGNPEGSFELNNLAEGEEYDFRVYTESTGTYTDFEFCAVRLDYAIAEGDGCTQAPAVTFDGTGQPGDFIEIRTATGIVASIENTQPLGEVNVSFYDYDGPLRQSDSSSALYLNRNISIVPTTQPADTVAVRLYLSEQDIQSILDTGIISSMGELDVTKVSNVICSASFPGGGQKVQFRGAAGYGRGGYIEIAVADFSEFFIHPASEPLISSIRQNGTTALTWGIAPNPVIDRLTLTAPAELEQLPVTAEVFDIAGRRVTTAHLPPGRQRYLTTHDWPRGTYVIVLTGGDHRVSARLVK